MKMHSVISNIIITLLLFTGAKAQSSFVRSQPSLAELLDSLQHYAPTDSIKFLRYRALFSYYRDKSPGDSAIWYADQGIREFNQKNYIRGTAALLYLEGGFYIDRRIFDSATARLTAALKIYSALKKPAKIARIYNMLGVVEGNKGNYTTSINYSITAEKIAEIARDTEAIALSEMSLAVTYDRIDNQEMIIKHTSKALTLAKYLETWNQILLNNNLGSLYAVKKDYAHAVPYLNKALALCNTSHYASYSPAAHLALGEIFLAMKQVPEAMYHYNKAQKIAEKFDFPEERSKALKAIAALKMQTDPKAALGIYRQALSISRRAMLKEVTASTLMGMIEACHKIGDNKQALALTEEQQLLKDSLFNLEKAKTIAKVQSTYDLAKANEAAHDLETVQNLEERKRMIAIIFAAGLCITLTIILIFWRKAEVLNEKLNETAKELDQSENNLRINNSFKEQYYALLSNNLRAPMLHLKSTLKDFQTNPAAYSATSIHQCLDSFYISTSNMYRLTDSFTSWIRAIDPACCPIPRLIDIDALLQEIEEQYNDPATMSTLVDVIIAPGLSHQTDRELLLTIVRNVVDNAVLHGHANKIIITAERTGEDCLQLCIENNGSPIAEELLQKLNTLSFVTAQPGTDTHQSFGYQIIAVLTGKLSGIYNVMNTTKGPKVNFVFGSIA